MPTARDPDQQRLRRKLNSGHRLKMARLAVERFRVPELRGGEADAKTALVKAFLVAQDRIPGAELRVLEAHGYAQTVSRLEVPTYLFVKPSGSRDLERPDGVVVTREGSGKVRVVFKPGSDEYELPRFETWSDALKCVVDRGDGYGRQAEPIRLPREVLVPGTMSPGEVRLVTRDSATARDVVADSSQTAVSRANALSLDNSRTPDFVTPDLQSAVLAYFAAADARILAERRLIVAAIKVISSCTTYGQALAFWPEVEELEESLFGAQPLPPSLALVAISDEDRLALCQNMTSRGLDSSVCRVRDHDDTPRGSTR
jgi:hypothetical protein